MPEPEEGAEGGLTSGDLALPTADDVEPDDAEEVDGEAVDPPDPGSEEEQLQIYQEFSSHSGPLPAASWLEAAEKLHPGATKEIVQDYTAERAHQRKLKDKAVELDGRSLETFVSYQRLRLLVAAALALFIAAGGLALIFAGKPEAGFVLLVAEIATLVLAFYGISRRKGPDYEEPPEESDESISEDLEGT